MGGGGGGSSGGAMGGGGGGSSGGRPRGKGTGVAISLANIFLLHQLGIPYIFGPGRQYPLLRH